MRKANRVARNAKYVGWKAEVQDLTEEAREATSHTGVVFDIQLKHRVFMYGLEDDPEENERWEEERKRRMEEEESKKKQQYAYTACMMGKMWPGDSSLESSGGRMVEMREASRTIADVMLLTSYIILYYSFPFSRRGPGGIG